MCYVSCLMLRQFHTNWRKTGAKKRLVKKWGCFATKMLRQRVNKIIIFLAQELFVKFCWAWFPCNCRSRVDHTSRLKMCSGDQGHNMETPPTNARRSRRTAMGPLQLNSRVWQKRLAREYGRQWNKKKRNTITSFKMRLYFLSSGSHCAFISRARCFCTLWLLGCQVPIGAISSVLRHGSIFGLHPPRR